MFSLNRRNDRGKRDKDPHSLKIYQKITETCTVSEYVIRDGLFHEYDNLYEVFIVFFANYN